MSLNVIAGAGGDIAEPDWERLIPDPENPELALNDWRDVAHQEWLRVTAALREAGTLAPENRHQLQRLVLAYIRYDIATTQVMRMGAIKLSTKKVPMLNMWQVEMRAADSDATTAEMELGITPRRRGSVTKVNRQQKRVSKADAYLGTAKKA